MMKPSALICGLLFGVGLAASGMTDTAKVIGFLDIFGDWDPDLIFVMGSAVFTTVTTFYFILKRKTPLFSDAFSMPDRTHIDRNLIGGAILFGLGWGLYGYCPGPAVAALAYLQPATFVFVLTTIAGLFIGKKIENNSNTEMCG